MEERAMGWGKIMGGKKHPGNNFPTEIWWTPIGRGAHLKTWEHDQAERSLPSSFLVSKWFDSHSWRSKDTSLGSAAPGSEHKCISKNQSHHRLVFHWRDVVRDIHQLSLLPWYFGSFSPQLLHCACSSVSLMPSPCHVVHNVTCVDFHSLNLIIHIFINLFYYSTFSGHYTPWKGMLLFWT